MLSLALALALVTLCALPRAGQAFAQTTSDTRADKLSPDLRERLRASHGAQDRVEVVIQLDGDEGGQLRAFLNRNGVHVKGRFENLGAIAAALPLDAVEELAAFNAEVAGVSLDRELTAAGHLSATTGATLVRSQTDAKGKTYTLDGTGQTIAILDSGIDATHKSFVATGKIKFSKDFTGEGTTADPFGHGTHVASIAAGLSAPTSGKYEGIAHKASLVNLRVLGSMGTGKVSNVLAALNWLLVNGKSYGVRVVNMSLGAPAVESYKIDPLCIAVRKLVNAGMVVVADVGHDGKNSAGQKVYGLVHSPGHEPSALTVGASNTLGMDARGVNPITKYQKVYGDGILLSDSVVNPLAVLVNGDSTTYMR